MATYRGNIYGERAYFVFDRTTATGGTNANFLDSIDISGTTSQYVAAGGATYGSTAELAQFIGNVAYLNNKRTQVKTLSSLDKSGGITTTVVKYTPDPRITLGIYASGDASSFTGHHMDEIHVTETTGATFQAFLGKLTYPENNSTVPAGYILVDLLAYGISGSDISDSTRVFGTGFTLANKINGVEAEVKSSGYIEYIRSSVHKSYISSQVGASYDFVGSGLTGITIGVGANAKLVFFSPNNKELYDFVSSALPAFAFGGSGASGTSSRQSNVFTLLAGTTGDINGVILPGSNPVYGLTLNAITGGTLGNSEFEEFAHHVIHTYVGKLNNKGSIIYTINTKNSVRGVDQVSF